MIDIGQIERKTQDRVVELFSKRLGYEYLGNWEHREDNSNIEEKYLTKHLKSQGYSDKLVSGAIFEFRKAATDQSKNLYDVNKEIYSMLRYGVKIKESVEENKQTVLLIDWQNPLNNHFAFAEEVTLKGTNNKRPDIVLFINGVALGVLELKRSTISVSEGIRQNLDNQRKDFIERFFTTIQLVMAGNDPQGLRYGTIETSEKYFLSWKEEPQQISEEISLLDENLIDLCSKQRLIEILYSFVVFDAGTKKLCRPNQYFGVKNAQEYIRRREGGVIWHTQGSGKSLTMVWLTKWIRENIENARVLIVTDRQELDEQIKKVFFGVEEEIYRTTSCADLVNKLNNTLPWLLCSLVHKFGNREEDSYDDYINEITSLKKDFIPKGNIFVFVDECHRTQSGKLHSTMKQILPNALFIGFTGTPLLKKDKQSSLETFGSYIHTYKFNDAVQDKIVLDLCYEARNIEQNLTSQDKVDQWFDSKTQGMNDLSKAELKRKWGTMQRVLSSQSRLEKIVADILLDFETKDRLQNGKGNAILVSDSIYQACKYYDLFQSKGFTKCAIITSFDPNPNEIKGETTGEGYTEKLMQYEIYKKMLNGKSAEDFEREVKNKFIKEPAQMKLLIVVDKLLTGFDSPPTTYLYIDKNMQEHGLFQAICRVNRLDGEDKEYGYIVDYKDLFRSIEKAVSSYTSEALAGYEKGDVEGLLVDRIEIGRQRLDNSLEAIRALCEPVLPPKDGLAYSRFFCGSTQDKDSLKNNEQKRVTLYKCTASLIRAYANIANDMEKAGFSEKEAIEIKEEVRFYDNLRKEIQIASYDYIDLKLYEPAMRHLFDSYISAGESEKISAFDNKTLLDLITEIGLEKATKELPKRIRENKQATAETVENNIRKLIIDETPTNPKYFEKMSVLLDELIEERRDNAKSYEKYLKEIEELALKVRKPENSSTYPVSINTPAKRALFDNLDNDEKLANKIDEVIKRTKQDDFRGDKFREKQLKREVKRLLEGSIHDIDIIFDIIKNQSEY